MEPFRIRIAETSDSPALAVLAQETFRETFTHYPPHELTAYLDEHYNASVFAGYVQDAKRRVWLAEAGGKPIAYAILGAYKLPLSPALLPVCELYRLYIKKSWHGRKIGATLMDLAQQTAISDDAKALYLGVWEGNKSAQAFYAYRGFSKVGEYNYPPVGSTTDREWILMKIL